MTELARAVSALSYLVAGVDLKSLLSRTDDPALPCWNPLADFEDLSRFLDERYALGQKRPVLVGYAAGGSLAYAVLAQAPVHSFHAVISLEFCPRLAIRRRLCPGQQHPGPGARESKGQALIPREHLETGWFVFLSDSACPDEKPGDFVNRIDNARPVTLPGESPGMPEQKAWQPQLLSLLQWLDPGIPRQVRPDADLHGVPLIEVNAAGGTPPNPTMAVLLSGDGGWAELDRSVSAELAKRGIPTVGWDSLSYFWKPKTPDQAGFDLEQVLRHYTRAWNKDKVILIGYSLGADVLSFMANRLSPEMKSRVLLVAFLGLGRQTSFEFHLTDWLGFSSQNSLPVVPEVERLTWAKRLCIYGEQEPDSGCPDLSGKGVTLINLPGDHHFGRDYSGIVGRLLECALR
ncbi:MAG: AcvB/VirJ family lysyl-phosphatidylglycerol hydrolase [bacterium]